MKTKYIEHLIELSEKKTSLLRELKESVIYEEKIYDLIRFDMGFQKNYVLYLISGKKELKSGRISDIKSYIRLRNIDIKTIHNNNVLLTIDN